MGGCKAKKQTKKNLREGYGYFLKQHKVDIFWNHASVLFLRYNKILLFIYKVLYCDTFNITVTDP